MNQIEYNTIQEKIINFKNSLNLSEKDIQMLNKLDKLMINEYKYGSSNSDIKKIHSYLIILENIN